LGLGFVKWFSSLTHHSLVIYEKAFVCEVVFVLY